MFLVRGTLGLVVKLMKKLPIKWKVCGCDIISCLIVNYRNCVTFNCLMLFVVGLPGVLFVLPDSYVDAENKDYGGK